MQLCPNAVVWWCNTAIDRQEVCLHCGFPSCAQQATLPVRVTLVVRCILMHWKGSEVASTVAAL